MTKTDKRMKKCVPAVQRMTPSELLLTSKAISNKSSISIFTIHFETVFSKIVICQLYEKLGFTYDQPHLQQSTSTTQTKFQASNSTC